MHGMHGPMAIISSPTAAGGPPFSMRTCEPQDATGLHDVTDDTHGQSTDAVIAALVGRDARVLDLSAGSERLIELLAHQGCTIVAVQEERPPAAALAAFAERVIVSDPETLEFADALGGEAFDVVVA